MSSTDDIHTCILGKIGPNKIFAVFNLICTKLFWEILLVHVIQMKLFNLLDIFYRKIVSCVKLSNEDYLSALSTNFVVQKGGFLCI